MRVRNGLLNLDGVLLCDVYLEHGVAVAAFDPNRVEKAELLTAVAEAGNDGRHHYHANILEVKPLPETITSSEEGRTRV
jgi:copper chaperone CopZ